MDLTLKQIIYYSLTLLLGIFLRDIYSWFKGKIFKGEKPRISINYSCKWFSTSPTTPREYKFKCNLMVKNIDTIPIYDVIVSIKEGKNKKEIIRKDSLSPNDSIEDENSIIIQYGDTGNYIEEAKGQIPIYLREPSVFVGFKNKNGKKFHLEKSFQDSK